MPSWIFTSPSEQVLSIAISVCRYVCICVCIVCMSMQGENCKKITEGSMVRPKRPRARWSFFLVGGGAASPFSLASNFGKRCKLPSGVRGRALTDNVF